MGCSTDAAPYVLRGLLARFDVEPRISWQSVSTLEEGRADVHLTLVAARPSKFSADSPEKAKLAAAFLAKDCAGARGLSEAEIAKLKAIRDSAAPPAPKP